MPGKIGASTICTSIIPNFKELNRIYPRKLSKEAKQRLRVLEFYYKKANQNISLTARHFGVSRNYIYKWLKRYNRWNLATLEDKSRRPKHTRSVQYDLHTVNIIRKIRKEYPSFSAVKVAFTSKERWQKTICSMCHRPIHQKINHILRTL